MAVIRGALLSAALSGDYGKPRPCLVIQSDLFSEHPSVTLLSITSQIREVDLFRIYSHPTPENGLRVPSQIMVDRAHTVSRDRLGPVFGQLEDDTLQAVDWALAGFLGLLASK